jgi:hypothetical protein
MYIRFVVGKDTEDHRLLTGVITEARFLSESGELEGYQVAWLEETYQWLNENLPCPPFSTNTKLKDGACWFKSCAGEPIKKVWEIVGLLKVHDVPVRVLKSKMPGKCLYEDDFQIIVEERKKL